jgi:predicted RNase H-like nuclease (RuvC/YqgF family)
MDEERDIFKAAKKEFKPAKTEFKALNSDFKPANLESKISKENKYNRNMLYVVIVVSIIAVSLFGLFVIRPAVVGYATYSDMKKTNQSINDYSNSVEKLQSQITVYETNMSSCQAYNDKLMAELKTSSNSLSECNSKLTAIQINYDNYKNKTEEQIMDLNAQIATKDETIKTFESNYNVIAQNTANNLCCKARIDNSRISSYKVENNKVVCLEEGEKNISC